MPIDPQRILYRDDHLLVVSKLPGELVVRGKGALGKFPLVDFLRREYPGLRAVHRLDFLTSGCVVFARTKAAHAAILNTKFDRWQKTYVALVAGSFRQKAGTIEKPLPARTGGTVHAVTRYRVLEDFRIASLVEATIATGRHHQIRRHFAAIGHPLLLDEEEGNVQLNRDFARRFGYRKFFLHAARLTFPHPITGRAVRIEAPLPKAFQEVLRRLGARPSQARSAV
jgi:23S rRNA pseudouridine955/2504/2580 synthase